MFTVGEFSRIAQVSKRLLRYYDEIGLLKPVRTDDFTGYRYYSAEQLPELNRILALKELGLSLDQIHRMLRDKVSTEELQGMLQLKKAEIEQHVLDEYQRLRNIESRLQFIRSTEKGKPLDVVIKQIPALSVLSLRTVVEDTPAAFIILARIMAMLPQKSAYGPYFGIWYNDGLDDREVDVEIGLMLNVKSHDPVVIQNGQKINYRELPAAETLATYVMTGSPENAHIGYGTIGAWVEANNFRFVGPPREIALQRPQQADSADAVTEIQFPVERVSQA